MFAIKTDGLIYTSGRDLSYFPRSIHHLVLTQDQVMSLPLDRQLSIYNRNAEMKRSGWVDEQDAREAMQKLLSNFTLPEITMAKRNPNQSTENAETIQAEAGTETTQTQAADAGGEKASRSRTAKNTIVHLKSDKNPKRDGSSAHKRFALYRDGMTVGEFLEAGGTMGDINFDSAKGFITLEAVAEPAAETTGDQAQAA